MSKSKRALSLDALRGFAILTMVLSGVIPYKGLPAWMYHAQTPPPTRQFNPDLPGLTWVDLVFPFFIFALGAALALALTKRIERGYSRFELLKYIVERSFLLGFFAIFLFHARPHIINPGIYSNPTLGTWLLALLGFIIMFIIFVRLPKQLSKKWRWILRISGWTAAVLFLVFVRYPNDEGFSLYRSDIIIVVLTNVYFFGSLIYLMTRHNWLGRLCFLGLLIALRLAHPETGWVKAVWNFSPIPWIYKLYYLQYLFIAIPGTMAGDLFLRWTKTAEIENERQWSPSRLWGIVLLMMTFLVIQLVGLQARRVWQTVVLSLGLIAIGIPLFSRPGSETEKLLRRLFFWGAYCLILGLIFEPYEGGIKKDHPTLSYYFVTTGLAIFLLNAFTIIIDMFKKSGWVRLLIDNGQNPMIAYVGFANLLWPVLGIFSLNQLFNQLNQISPWLGFVRGVVYTLIIALIVQYFTKKKLYWRT